MLLFKLPSENHFPKKHLGVYISNTPGAVVVVFSRFTPQNRFAQSPACPSFPPSAHFIAGPCQILATPAARGLGASPPLFHHRWATSSMQSAELRGLG
jgi:hypothetical protein